MLEDRVRFHWATRMFLWFVRVPNNKVAEKAEQYKAPPDAGAVIVHDDGEEWKAQSPVIRGSDASPDLKAVRMMIDAGSGYPPHWRGEATDVNLATAQAMQEPAERHLKRRQNYMAWLLQDLTFHAYQRARMLRPELWPQLPSDLYQDLYTVSAQDVSKADNHMLAQAAKDLSGAVESLLNHYPGSPKLRRTLLQMILRFAGSPPDEQLIDEIMTEAAESPAAESQAVTPAEALFNG